MENCRAIARTRNPRRCDSFTVEAGEERRLDDIEGDVMEFSVQADVPAGGVFGVKVRMSPDGAEQTSVIVDTGNGTLSVDGNMWTYTPKINRVVKVPSPMTSQNWMGSDFSNKDISKDTTIIEQYDHTLLKLTEHEGHQVYVIQSIPHEEAAVVWGREVLHIRDDWVMLQQQFWDQDDILVKTLKALQIDELSGRTVATVIRMGKEDAPDEWTEVRTAGVEFDVELSANLFTLSNLRNPRE